MANYEAPRLDRPWTEVNPGGVVREPGNSVTYTTGTWRSLRPVRDLSQCIHCLMCWIMCPDASVTTEGIKIVGFDYDHCKGCGICAEECPGGAIEMVPEAEATQSDKEK